MKTKWMLLMGILVLAMFVGVSMAQDRDRLRDGSCGNCLDFIVVDGYCDICGYDLLYDEDGNGPKDDDGDGIPNGQDDDYEKPADGQGDQEGQGPKGPEGPKGDGDQDGEGNQKGRD